MTSKIELETRRQTPVIAAILPCYKVTGQVLSVINAIGPEVAYIFCVDDTCPDGSGDFIEANCRDPRVVVVRNSMNMGVGGAVMNGYLAAIERGAEILVKIDGDGQMDPGLLPSFVQPIIDGEADYTKGNRFWDLRELHQMPPVRRLGNLALSFMSKLSTGYWDLFDPTNGYTAIHASVARELDMDSISRRYFFETDMLFRLNLLRAVVVDVPMHALYAEEESNLKIGKIVPEFLYKHGRNFVKRLAYNYYLRDMSVASLELLVGAGLVLFALAFGGWHWAQAILNGTRTALGTVMLPTVALVSGIQFLLAFLGYDIARIPTRALYPFLSKNKAPNNET